MSLADEFYLVAFVSKTRLPRSSVLNGKKPLLHLPKKPVRPLKSERERKRMMPRVAKRVERRERGARLKSQSRWVMPVL